MTKVKVGVLPISNVAPLYLGMKKGFFKEEGLEVEPVDRPERQRARDRRWSPARPQFAFLGLRAADVGALAGPAGEGRRERRQRRGDGEDKEWTLIAHQEGQPDQGARRTSRARRSPSNALKGVGEVAIKAALEKRGVDPNTIKLLEVPFPEMPAALAKGRVDAIWAPEPFLTSVLGEGGQDVEAPLTTLGPKFPNGTYAHDGEADRARTRTSSRRFARAINKSSEYATAHPDEARATIPTFTKIPPEVAKKIRLPLWPRAIDEAKLRELLDYAVEYKVIEKPPKLDDVIWEGARTDRCAAWLAPLAAVAVLLVLWELVVQGGIVAETSIPPASAALSELVAPARESGVLVGGRLDAAGLGARARDRDRARGARWGC